ncbi:MAG: contractile injection system protein, VgrG/Pvc8 family [Sandaracinaceae bacterium]
MRTALVSVPTAALLALCLSTAAHAQQLPRGPAQRGVNASAAPDVWLATSEGFRQFEVISISSNEALGQSATHLVSANVSDPDLNAEGLLGQAVMFGIRTGPRHFEQHYGVVRSASLRVRTGPDGDVSRVLDLDIASPLYLLATTDHDRVFEDRTREDVVRAVFAGYPGLGVRVEARLPATRQTFVQHGEDDLSFLRRLLDPEGVALLIGGDGQRAAVVLSDGRGRPRIARRFGTDGFESLQLNRRLGAAMTVSRPPVDAGGAPRVLHSDGPVGAYGGSHIHVRLPGSVSDEGARRVLRGLHDRAGLVTLQLAGGAQPRPGDVMRVEGHDDPELNRDYRVLSVSSGMSGDGTMQRYGTFVLAPAARTFSGREGVGRLRVGPERVLVLSSPGGAARVGEHGRVRIRFGWGAAPDGTQPEMWVPFSGATPRAGAGYVTFEGGRADAPVFVGSSPR